MSQNMKIMAFSGDLLNRQTQAWFLRMINETFKVNKIECLCLYLLNGILLEHVRCCIIQIVDWACPGSE